MQIRIVKQGWLEQQGSHSHHLQDKPSSPTATFFSSKFPTLKKIKKKLGLIKNMKLMIQFLPSDLFFFFVSNASNAKRLEIYKLFLLSNIIVSGSSLFQFFSFIVLNGQSQYFYISLKMTSTIKTLNSYKV